MTIGPGLLLLSHIRVRFTVHKKDDKILIEMGKKLLVADDSLTIQKVIRLALSNEGYEIQAVSDGQELMEQVSLFRPQIIIVDASIPKKSAFEIKKELDNEPQSPKVILMSSAFDEIDEAAVSQLHFDGRLTKPFDPAHLRQVLNSVSGRSEFSSTVNDFSDDIWDGTQGTDLNDDESIDDIKKLTEDTVKQSGWLDDSNDSQSSHSDVEFNIPPPRQTDDSTGWGFNETAMSPQSVGDKTLADMWMKEPTLEPPSNVFSDSDSPQFDINDVNDLNQETNNELSNDFVSSINDIEINEPTQTKSSINTGEIEKIVAEELKKILPQIAEKVIKKEIDKLLRSL